MTVITPVFMEGQGDGAGPSFFVASRGHHADVGGIAPGSMPPLSKTLEEVGHTMLNSAGGGLLARRGVEVVLLGVGVWWVPSCCTVPRPAQKENSF